MNTRNDQGHASNSRWFILGGLLVIALVAGTVAWIKLSPPPTNEPVRAAGAETFDVDRARRELEDLQQRAMQVMGAKQNVDLIPQARELVERYPRFAPAHLLLGQIYLHQGDMAQGYQSLDMSLRYDSQQPEVQQLAGSIAQSLGRHETASTHYANAVGLDPSNSKLRVFLAQSYINQNRFDEARMALLQALQINSNMHEAYFALSSLDARQGKLEQAIMQASRAIDLLTPEDKDSTRESYVRWQAKLLQRDNRPDDALQALEKLSPSQRRSPGVLEDMAISWQMIGKPANGAQLYEEALSYQPDAWPLALGAARWYLKAGDKPNARRMADAIRRINPTAPALEELNQQLK